MAEGAVELVVSGMTCASCVARIAIALSSVFVVSNSLRLRRFRAVSVDPARAAMSTTDRSASTPEPATA